MRIFNLLIALSLLFLIGCSDAPHPITSFSGIEMTIPYRIQVGQKLSSEESEKVQQQIAAIFQNVNNKFNKWNPLSELSSLNQAGANEPIAISQDLFELMQIANAAYKITEGLFDPTVETVNAYTKPFFEKGVFPDQSKLDELASLVDWKEITWEEGIFSKPNALIQIDFGGIAKGYCVDQIALALKSLDYPNLYIEWGGEIRAEGQHPSGRPWNVAIKDPKGDQIINLEQSSIATSGDEYQYYIIRVHGENIPEIFSHIYNPKTKSFKKIQKGGIGSCSITFKDCWYADALATAAYLHPNKESASDWLRSLKESHGEQIGWYIQENPL